MASASPLATIPAEPTRVEALITKMELRAPKDAPFSLQFIPLQLPFQLPVIELKPGDKTSPLSWPLPLSFQSDKTGITLLFDKQAEKIRNGKSTLNFTAKIGTEKAKVTAIDSLGKVTEYELAIVTTRIENGAAPTGDPVAFLVVGPVVYHRAISRSGAAITSSEGSAVVPGIRGIYRRRAFKNMTDRLPGAFKLFFDGSGTIGKTVSGDALAQGLPIWGDARMTAELFQTSGARFELGAGLSYFRPGLSEQQAGDLQSFLGLVLSARVGYPITKSLFCLVGLNMVTPSTSSGTNDVLVSQPLEAFLSLSIPKGPTGFTELRFKFYRITTNGEIAGVGKFERAERFFGPELLFSKRFN